MKDNLTILGNMVELLQKNSQEGIYVYMAVYS